MGVSKSKSRNTVSMMNCRQQGGMARADESLALRQAVAANIRGDYNAERRWFARADECHIESCAADQRADRLAEIAHQRRAGV